ncbi:hypothetical protein TRFO_14575 [Tritrichomonas foetus]|uniref:RING-type domain-containing protein n=1 Tax=Tritrichomonas foetus TaxID=1144522 RepID=A0A1J4KUY6_9EUKA|nr:hypothetical protein TRFO_14575 [Tritrichomonas foetus]|eukprot:OHT14938.1 hypothetical protein TRFO_14575 [Tritrichomonas foetus]
MSSEKQKKSKDSEDTTETEYEESDSEETASMEILTKIRQKLQEIGDAPFYSLTPVPSEAAEIENNPKTFQKTLKCISCLSDIKNGDILVSMPCCGGISHVSCASSILESKSKLLIACPQCLTPLSDIFVKKLTDVSDTLKQDVNQSAEPRENQ